jgi:hypothetical protein
MKLGRQKFRAMKSSWSWKQKNVKQDWAASSDHDTELIKSLPVKQGTQEPRLPIVGVSCWIKMARYCTTVLLSHWLETTLRRWQTCLKVEADPKDINS